MNALLDAALLYAERGWPIFPCNANKEPLTENGVLDATTDREQIHRWWDRWPRANVAMDVGGAGLIALDLDPGHDRAELERNVGPLTTGLRARTPRGGEHLFFELAPGEVAAPSQSKLASKVDVRSFHSYVLLAPSRTADGTYVWEGSGRPAFRTDEMVRLTNTGREKHQDRDHWIIEADLPENVANCIRWLKNDAKISIMGQGGEGIAYATAAHCKSFGISQALAFDLMWEHWNPRCSPPWGNDEVDHLEQKVENGYRYNTSPPGNITPAYKIARSADLFKPVEKALPSGRELTAGRFRFVDRAGMAHISPPKWLIEGVLPEDAYAILFGASGSFKTFLALDMALSIATGVDFPWSGCWEQVNVNGPVLYCAGEGRGNIHKRISAWEDRHYGGRKAEQFILGDPIPLVTDETSWDAFIDGALAMSPAGYKLVTVDTVGRAMQGVNENSQEHASKFTKFAQILQAELGCTVLGLHHTGHEASDRERGSSVFRGDADITLRAQRLGTDFMVSLEQVKTKDSDPISPKLIRLEKWNDGDTLVPVPATSTEARAASSKVERLEADEEINIELVSASVERWLKTNRTKAWSNSALADAVATDDQIEVGSSQIRQRYLKLIREDSKNPLRRCYEAATGRWRYKEI